MTKITNETRAQGQVDSYVRKVEATAKPRQAQKPRPRLKITIPNLDTSKPDGDAAENGALLSASELKPTIHATEFPTIAQMARDYLSIPATISIERVFSKSRHIYSNLQGSLKEMTLHTKAWILRSGPFDMMPKQVLRRKHRDNRKK